MFVCENPFLVVERFLTSRGIPRFFLPGSKRWAEIPTGIRGMGISNFVSWFSWCSFLQLIAFKCSPMFYRLNPQQCEGICNCCWSGSIWSGILELDYLMIFFCNFNWEISTAFFSNSKHFQQFFEVGKFMKDSSPKFEVVIFFWHACESIHRCGIGSGMEVRWRDFFETISSISTDFHDFSGSLRSGSARPWRNTKRVSRRKLRRLRLRKHHESLGPTVGSDVPDKWNWCLWNLEKIHLFWYIIDIL